MDQPSRYIFRNASVLDAARGERLADRSVLVEGEHIVEVGGSDVQASDAHVFDLRVYSSSMVTHWKVSRFSPNPTSDCD